MREEEYESEEDNDEKDEGVEDQDDDQDQDVFEGVMDNDDDGVSQSGLTDTMDNAGISDGDFEDGKHYILYSI